LLADTVGELPMLYAASDVAFVGGSLAPIGGHNLLEPAALGLPVLTGPSHFNGKEIAQLLLQQGAAAEVANPADLAAVLAEPEPDPHDIGLLETTLAMTADQRLQRLKAYVRFVQAGRAALGNAP